MLGYDKFSWNCGLQNTTAETVVCGMQTVIWQLVDALNWITKLLGVNGKTTSWREKERETEPVEYILQSNNNYQVLQKSISKKWANELHVKTVQIWEACPEAVEVMERWGWRPVVSVAVVRSRDTWCFNSVLVLLSPDLEQTELAGGNFTPLVLN